MSATIYSFPPRETQGGRAASVVFHPHALDFSRATPADDAAIEQLRANTRAVMRAQTQAERAELVSAFLLHLDNNPHAPCHCYAVRDIEGKGHVAAHAAGQTFRLAPDDARTAAQALIAENAFPGCVGIAANLRETAAVAEIRPAHGGPLAPSTETSGRTGFASTAILGGLIVLMLAVSAWATSGRGLA